MPEKRFIPPHTRRSGVRDARLIIIASEGTNTEKQYFDALQARYRNTRIHPESIERRTTASDPAHVMKGLDDFRKEYKIRPGDDELWLVIDVDRWGEAKLAEVARKCQQKGYELAVSNPCFEVWLLLHIKALHEYPPEKLVELYANRKVGGRTCLEAELLNLLGAYNKFNLDPAPFIPHVAIAIERARGLDIHPEHRWPNHLGTRVYLLAQKIIARTVYGA
jgi:hypothetical protein